MKVIYSGPAIGKHLYLLAFLLFGLLLVTLGCEEEEGGGAIPGTGQPDVTGELRILLPSGEPKTIDPNRAAFANEISVVKQLFRSLLWFDQNLNVVPMAAKEVPTVENGGISRDGLTYTFRLRDGLKWSDGQPLTAADFEYSIKRLLDPTVAADYAAFYYDIKGAQEFNSSKETAPATLEGLRAQVGVKAADDKSLIVSLANPHPTFLQIMALWPASPLRKDVIEKHGDKWTEPGNIVSNGPFILKEWAHQDRLTFEPNPNWWGDDKPKAAKVTFRIITDQVQAYNAYLAGELDMVRVPPEQTESVRNDPKLSKENVLHTELAAFAHQFNNLRPPFDNPKVRQAFSMAFDREAFLRVVYRGIGQVAYGWIPPGMPGHDKDLGLQWKLDVEKAKKTLAEAGYPNGQGLPKISFTYANTAANPQVAQFTQEQFKRNLGIDIELEPLEPRAFSERISNEDFQFTLLGLGADYPDPENFLPEFWGCKKYEGNKCTQFAGNNHAQYANPEFDKLMEQAAKELDNKKRLEIYAKAQKILVDDAPVIFTRYRATNWLIRSSINGLVRTGMDGDVPGDFFLEKTSAKG